VPAQRWQMLKCIEGKASSAVDERFQWCCFTFVVLTRMLKLPTAATVRTCLYCMTTEKLLPSVAAVIQSARARLHVTFGHAVIIRAFRL
jgi:hypothetical protein